MAWELLGDFFKTDKDYHEPFHRESSASLSWRQADPLPEPVLTCFSLAALLHHVWTAARSSMGEDGGILDFCRVKHLERLQEKSTWLKIKVAGQCELLACCPLLLIFRVLSMFILSFLSGQRASLNFWFPLGTLREARGTKYRKSCGENFSFITVPRLLPFLSLRLHLQPHGASQFLPALRNSPQFTSARGLEACARAWRLIWRNSTLLRLLEWMGRP